MKSIFLRSVFLVLSFLTMQELYAQSSPVVNSRLRMVAMGKVEEVRAGLPELQDEYPDDTGVLFLSAIVTDNALRALRIYEGIVKNSPKNEWADDAQWRIVQFYALKRDTARAVSELQNYRLQYPNSEFLLSATDLVKSTVGTPRANVRTLSSAHATTTASTVSRTPPRKETEKAPGDGGIMREAAREHIPAGPVQTPVEKTALRYGLQVAVYSERESAESEVNRFKSKRLRASVLQKDVNGESRFAVVVGDYSSRESAEKAQPVVQNQCACAPFVVEK